MHAKVLVIGENPDELLWPFHTFTATGEDDEFVKDVDETEYYKNNYEIYKNWAKTKSLSFTEYASEDRPIVVDEKLIDRKGKHQFGYTLLDEKGNVKKVVDRRNPNNKWDYYVFGGRWKGTLVNKKNERVSRLRKGDLLSLDCISAGAILANGMWHEPGSNDEKVEKAFDDKVNKIISSLPDEALISVYDIHY